MTTILSEVQKERQRQNEKWGIQDHNAVEWVAILTEEVGEVSKEAVDFHFANGDKNVKDTPSESLQGERLMAYRKECIQVAAVAVQMVESLDRQTNGIFK